jgi:hypothetical protein
MVLCGSVRDVDGSRSSARCSSVGIVSMVRGCKATFGEVSTDDDADGGHTEAGNANIELEISPPIERNKVGWLMTLY